MTPPCVGTIPPPIVDLEPIGIHHRGKANSHQCRFHLLFVTQHVAEAGRLAVSSTAYYGKLSPQPRDSASLYHLVND